MRHRKERKFKHQVSLCHLLTTSLVLSFGYLKVSNLVLAPIALIYLFLNLNLMHLKRLLQHIQDSSSQSKDSFFPTFYETRLHTQSVFSPEHKLDLGKQRTAHDVRVDQP